MGTGAGEPNQHTDVCGKRPVVASPAGVYIFPVIYRRRAVHSAILSEAAHEQNLPFNPEKKGLWVWLLYVVCALLSALCLVVLTLPCLMSLIALQMRLPCTDTHSGLTCTLLWLNLTLIIVLIVLVSLARAPSSRLSLLSQVAGGCEGFGEALAR